MHQWVYVLLYSWLYIPGLLVGMRTAVPLYIVVGFKHNFVVGEVVR